MTYICYVGIEISANFQKVLLGIELTMLIVLSVVALVKVANGTAPAGHLTPSWSWFNPFGVNFTDFVDGLTLMLFIYWGWDTAVSVNEETRDPDKIPGRAAVLSTLVLLATYGLVVLSVQSFAGLGTKGIGLGNPNNQNDVLRVLGHSVFGSSGFGSFLTHLLILMVLSSAAASTQTTILPTARTTLSMAVYKAIPGSFAKIHRRYLTPTVSTLAMGGASIVLYVIMNYVSAGTVIADSVTALGVMIAFYYGLTGLACAWYYRKTLTRSTRDLFMRGVLPLVGWAIMWAIGGYSLGPGLGPGQQLHLVDRPGRPLARGRRLSDRRRGARTRGGAHGRLFEASTAVLPGRGAEREHADPGARERLRPGHRPARPPPAAGRLID